MKYPGNTVVHFQPVSPVGPPYDGQTGEGGMVLMLDGNPYVYDDRVGGYMWQEPGNPPGDWHYVYRVGDYYVKEWAAASTMNRIPTEVGQNS